MASRGDYKLFTELDVQPGGGGPINCLLFIKNATLLVSGGDDQTVRIWDIENNECLQELCDHQWGQITALSWLPEQLDKAPVLFIGTGRGVVSAYPFSKERTQFVRQASTTTPVFILDDSVEVQTLDSLHSRFAVASHSGQIQMFAIKDTTTLVPLWAIQVQDIPRSIFFYGDQGERLVVHVCCLGEVIYCASDNGNLIERGTLHGGIGSATLSTDGGMKAVYNLSTGNFDLYEPADSLIPTTLPLPTQTRLIKQCVFAGEGGRTLVCGGDNGTVHTYQLDDTSQLRSWLSQGASTLYALAAFSTLDYHFVACGESEEPATIFIWRQPTQKRAAEDRKLRRLQADKDSVTTHAAQKDKEAKVLREKLAAMKQKYEHETRKQTNTAARDQCLLFSSVCLFILSVVVPGIFWWVYKPMVHYKTESEQW